MGGLIFSIIKRSYQSREKERKRGEKGSREKEGAEIWKQEQEQKKREGRRGKEKGGEEKREGESEGSNVVRGEKGGEAKRKWVGRSRCEESATCLQ